MTAEQPLSPSEDIPPTVSSPNLDIAPDPAGTLSSASSDVVGQMGGFKRLLGASAWLLSANSVALGLGFAQSILIARVLGPHEYGLLALVMTYPTTVGQVLDSRAWEAATAYLIRYRAAGDHAKAAAVAKLCYLIDTATAVLAVAAVAATSQLAARLLLKNEALANLLLAFATTLLAGAPAGTSLVLLRVAGRFRAVALQNTVSAVIRFLAIVTALVQVGTLRSVVWAYVAAGAATALLALWSGSVGARSLGLGGLGRVFTTPLGPLRRDIHGIARFLTVTSVSGLLKVVQRQGDILLVGYVLGPASAGFVRLARLFSDLLNVPVAPVYEASYPAFATLWRHGRVRELRALARKVTLSSSAFGLSGALVLVLMAEPLVRLTAGAEYVPAALPLRLFAVAMGLAVSTSVWHPLLVTMDRPGRSLIANAAGIVVQVLILLLGLSQLGTLAAGLAYLGFYLTWIPLVGLAVSKTYNEAPH
jgi:O-antigen/teichoic acid export membrane protein